MSLVHVAKKSKYEIVFSLKSILAASGSITFYNTK